MAHLCLCVCVHMCVCVPALCVALWFRFFLVTWFVVFIGAVQGLMTCLRGEHCSSVQQQKALAAEELLSFPPEYKHAQTGDCQYPQGSLDAYLSGILQELSPVAKGWFSSYSASMCPMHNVFQKC